DQRAQRRGRDEWNIPVEDKERSVAIELGKRLQDGVAGTELLLLDCPGEAFPRYRIANGLGSMADYHAELLRRQGPRRSERVRQQWAAGEGVQYLGKVRMHALALARSKHDDLEGHGYLRDLSLRIAASCAMDSASSACALATSIAPARRVMASSARRLASSALA